LAKEAGLEVSDGIIVNNQCQTSDPDILAAGDCASFLYQNNLIRLESVQNAIDQGEAVAETLLGAQSSYKPHPWFWSDQFDVKLQIAGLNKGYDQTLVRKGSRDGGQSVWYYKKGTLIAVDAMNDATSYLIASRLIRNKVSPSAEIVVDSNCDLKSLLN
jgi:3-phenylpropionate/trans-cinnamate dioxygenase ferredoxin reductase subunit